MSKGAASRAAAARIVADVLEHGRSLSQALPQHTEQLEARDRALVQSLCYGVLRNLPLLNAALKPFLAKPLKKDLVILHHLLLVGAYQLLFMRTSDHAAVSATVEATERLKKRRQKGLVNAVLRNLQRQRDDILPELQNDPELQSAHPRWLADAIRANYGAQATAIFAANNSQAPMWLRVNTQQVSVTAFRQALHDYDPELQLTDDAPLVEAIQLKHAVDVRQLPGFAEGWFSVQDLSAQFAAPIVAAQAQERILDCCAAPGGKTAHILEREPSVEMVALDVDAQRLERVEENLARLQLNASILCANASDVDSWWDGQQFDRILLDAPCSATGVIRRHPDIKWLRRANDIQQLVTLQSELLEALWPLLHAGGRLVYATCSILNEENQQQIEAFCARHTDAQLTPIEMAKGQSCWQRLPGEQGGDGFFYACVEKQP